MIYCAAIMQLVCQMVCMRFESVFCLFTKTLEETDHNYACLGAKHLGPSNPIE